MFVTALMLLSACSANPRERVNLQPRPILPTLERMSRGDQLGVWMSSDDAANLTLWIQHMENVCR